MSQEERVPSNANYNDPINFVYDTRVVTSGNGRKAVDPNWNPVVRINVRLSAIDTFVDAVAADPDSIRAAMHDIKDNGWNSDYCRPNFRQYIDASGSLRPRALTTAEAKAVAEEAAALIADKDAELAALKAKLAELSPA